MQAHRAKVPVRVEIVKMKNGKMKKPIKWTVECGKVKHPLGHNRDDAVKFIASHLTAVTGIRHYGVLTTQAIPMYKEALRLNKNSS